MHRSASLRGRGVARGAAVRTLAARHESLPLARPFRISRGARTVAEVVVVELTGDGVTGRGESVPYPRYGESVEGVLAAIESVRAALEAGADREELMPLLPPGAARNAVDCALWDLEAKQLGISVATRLVRPPLEPIVSAHTVVIDSPEAMAAAARSIAHVPLIKVKLDADEPAARLRAVRAAAPEAMLIVDPNEGWDRALLEAMQDVLIEARVALLEQPVPADDDAWLEGFDYAIPIYADEAVHVGGDLDRIAARYQGINVKLDKTGGLTTALDLAAAARARGMGLMCGCMVGSSLSIAPAMHVARDADFVDLDGPLWMAEDRAGGVVDVGGTLMPPQSGFWGD
ncbi:N-acetyl-D-Glu racemase DgcA [Sphingomonas sp. SUN039]|uniref:N-acetyl-D-Glu racemase DgcA n=1 Tax=Sphingomonas sp. SUN039 TaxID=2937787 RepID=UPI002164264C|nr:N-acetyl-D-Glu racemase DgcA [Sphingomonas sp. SUN039]UVO54614.1 dipeptide epimerase [Sphingomonas sp. SUN039]